MVFGVVCLIAFFSAFFMRSKSILFNEIITPSQDLAYYNIVDFCGFLMALSTLVALSLYQFRIFSSHTSSHDHSSSTNPNSSKSKRESATMKSIDETKRKSILEEKQVEDIIMELKKPDTVSV